MIHAAPTGMYGHAAVATATAPTSTSAYPYTASYAGMAVRPDSPRPGDIFQGFAAAYTPQGQAFGGGGAGHAYVDSYPHMSTTNATLHSHRHSHHHLTCNHAKLTPITDLATIQED